MRKPQRWITYILIMAIMVCSTAPVFAEAWTTTDVYQQQQKLSSILNYVLSIDSKMPSLSSSGMSVFESIDLRLGHLEDWFVPSGSRPSNYATLMDSIVVLADTVMNNLPGIYSYINGYFGTYSTQLTTQTGYLNSLKNAVINYSAANMNYGIWSWADASKYSHTQLLINDPFASGGYTGAYKVLWINDDGSSITRNYRWDYGSPIGNVVLMEDTINNNLVNSYSTFLSKGLKHYGDNLTTWDSQGDTLQQVAFTPESAIQGLYRYLAFTQRDVARLTYVLASDEEITAREKARDNQNAVLDNFIDDTGDGAISTNDFGSVADASKDIKDNLNTGVSASGIFDVFTGNHTSAWFSQTTADELDRTQANRSLLKANGLGASDYDTPLLDEKMEELLSIFGGDDKK